MQPASVINPTNNKSYLTQEHRGRLCQILNELDDNQLRFILTNHIQNSLMTHQFQHYTRVQLLQQCLILIDNFYSKELEQTLYSMKQQHFTPDFYQQQQQQQSNLPFSFNQQSYHSTPPNYRFSSSPAISEQLRSTRPTLNTSQSTVILNPRPHQPQQSPYMPSLLSHQQQVRHSSLSNNVAVSNNSSGVPRYPPPLLSLSSYPSTSSSRPPPSSSHPLPSSSHLPPSSSHPPASSSHPPASSSHPPAPSSSSHPPLILPSTLRPPIPKIVYKSLPFYYQIARIHERYYIFQYDQYRKQHISHDEFVLSFDVCNLLALSHDYDPNLNIHKTTKSLLLRLARIDQPPTLPGKYDDNLPPNLVIHVNGHPLTNLPIPKACTRQQNDLVRAGREIDITSHCMFNPMLKNEIKIAWSYNQDNTNLRLQYANAQYALHIFFVEHLEVDDLCGQVIKKPMRFVREDLVKLLAKARANDRDLGLEVSDQKLKLMCPIDQRRLKVPVRATTCQHLQCFDLTNYIALNEKSNKWVCPVCNKFALFDDLRIDSYTESILNSIQNENITEITINGDLQWSPVLQSNKNDDSLKSESNLRSSSSSTDIILIDDDD